MPASVPPLIEKALVAFFRRHVPFTSMAQEHLTRLAGAARLRYFADGARVLGPSDGPCHCLYMVQRGEVQSLRAGDGAVLVSLTEGECFPLGALIEARASATDYVARGDTFCYEFDKPVFDTLLAESGPLRDFCTRRLAHLLEQSQQRARAEALEEAQSRQGMTAMLASLVRRAPVSCAPSTPLADALATMETERVGAMLIVDGEGRTVGIFTERDLLRRVVLDVVPLSSPIERVMTRSPFCLPETANAFDAALAMAARGIRHVPLTRGEGPAAPLVGMVSERDLFALQRVGMRDIAGAIRRAATRDALMAAARDVRTLAANMLAQGVASGQLTQLIVALNDHLVEKAIALTAPGHDIAGIAWTWVALGSEGRREQTISTDQDNAIVFADAHGGAAAARERLLPFAKAVNAFLAELGFPLCKGDIMAGNPAWCLSVIEWQERFGDWIRNPTPQALLNAAIFFDLRPLAGERAPAEALSSWFAAESPGRPAFLRALAANALVAQPPLGFFGNLVDDAPLDLKAQGARPFIDAARVLALARGLPATATIQRLTLWADSGGDAALARATIPAFEFIQALRLKQQMRARSDVPNPNAVEAASLNDLDRRILKEAFRQARKLQERLKADYAL